MDMPLPIVLTPEQQAAIFSRAVQLDNAAITHANVSSDQEVRSIQNLKLDTAMLSTSPMRIGFPFKSFYVFDATDGNVAVNMKIGSQDSFNDSIPLKKGNFYSLPFPINQAFLDWTAQSGKTISILFFLRGTFGTNVQSLSIAGQVNVGDGSGVSTQTSASLTGTTGQLLFAQDLTRIKMQIFNASGTRIYLGNDATVTDDSGAKIGIPVEPGGQYAWENTAACYAVSQGGATITSKIGLTRFN